jgi:hypothetical protein
MGLRRIVMLSAAVAVLTSGSALAGEGKLGGEAFGDVYWVAADHDSAIEDINGLWIRRANLSYDYKWDDAFSGRVRVEAMTPGDFESDDVMLTFIKDAWVKYTVSTHNILLGLSQTPSLSLIEEIWGMRYIEKAPAELQRLVASRDMGIAAQGTFDEEKVFGYHVMAANGNGQIGEQDAKKKGYAALRFRPGNLVFEAYGDYEDRVDSGDRMTYHGLAGYKTDALRAGVQYVRQIRKETGEDVELRILSGWLAKEFSEQWWAFARVDRNFDENPGGDDIAYIPFSEIAANTFVVAGLDYWPTENVGFSPNVEVVVYDDPDDTALAKPDTDVIPRLTFHFTF